VAVLALTSMLEGAKAQNFYDVIHRPAWVRYDVLETENFELIFQRGLDTLVYEAAVTLESAYDEIRAKTGLDREFGMPVVLNNFTDVSNGFVSAAPFRQEITAAPIKGKVLSPRHSDWLNQVLPHEMAHAAQAEVKGGFGIGSLLGVMSSDLERALNLGIPSGMTEGLAVLHEGSESEGSGRLNFSMTLMQYRAAAASGKPWKIGQLLDPPAFTQPFDRYYIGGGVLTKFLTDSVKVDFFDRSLKFYNRVPFFGYGAALWYGTGEAPWKLDNAFARSAMEREFERLSRLGPISDFDVLTDERGLACRRPKWLSDAELVAHCTGYQFTPGFYRVDLDAVELDYAFHEAITEDFVVTLGPERETLAYAQYHPHGTVTISSRSNIHVLDVDTGNDRKISGSERCYAPVQLPDGRIWALLNDGQFNTVVEIREGEQPRQIFRQYGPIIRELAVGPGGEVIALANRSGEQAIFMFVEEVDGWFLWPLVASRQGAIYDPDWSPDGEHIVFAADPTGVSNIYVYSFADNRVRKLTNVKFGALEPSVSPDGSRVAFSHYEHEQYQLAVIALDIDELKVVPGFGHPREKARIFEPIHGEVRDSLKAKVRPYRPFPKMLIPRAVAPFVRFKEDRLSPFDERLGFGWGLTMTGADPLQQWSYSATAFLQSGRPWGRVTLKTGQHVLRPFLRLMNEPRTSTVIINDSTRARISLEERSARLGFSLPIRISRNVHSTSLILGLNTDYRLRRLINSDSEPLSPFDRRVTLNPSALFAYKLETNIRDLIPNSGILIGTTAETDIFNSDEAKPLRAWRSDLNIFLPFLKRYNQGIRLIGGMLWQNRGSIINVDTFVPRGYENELFLRAGTFLKAGLEFVQPVIYPDRGLILLPVTVEAVYLFGFGEAMGVWPEFDDIHSSVGVGIGARIRLFHNLGFDARIALARRIEDGEWDVSYR
jgi:hypothetical protein